MRAKLLVTVFGFLFLVITSANAKVSSFEYPKGLYKTFEDFVNKTPSDTSTDFFSRSKYQGHFNRFYNKDTKKALKDYFAVSDGKTLFIRLKGITKHTALEDNSQVRDAGDFHIPALIVGKNYLYFEEYFTSKAAVATFPLTGLAGVGLARRLKGFVFDHSRKEFNIFKNAKDFKYFISHEHPNYNNQADQVVATKQKKQLDLIRNVVNKIQ